MLLDVNNDEFWTMDLGILPLSDMAAFALGQSSVSSRVVHRMKFIAGSVCLGSLVLSVEALLPNSVWRTLSSTRSGMLSHRRGLIFQNSGVDLDTDIPDQYNFECSEGDSLHSTDIDIETLGGSSEGGTVKKIMARPTDKDIETLGGSSESGTVKKSGPKVVLTKVSDTKQPADIDIETLGGSSEGGGTVKKTKIGGAPVLALEGDSTIEQPWQRAVVAAHFAVVLFNVAIASQAILAGMDGMSTVEIATSKFAPILATIYASVVVGDFGTGVFHWSVDNYGSLKTPVVGAICHAFQGHHDTPWTITFRSFANNVFKIVFGCATPLLLLTAAPNVDPYARLFLSLFINWWLVSQELHKFSHMKKTPPLVKRFMDMGLILSKKQHGKHHTPPFNTNYCILTGQNNKWMDDSLFFRRLEKVVYDVTGNEANTWKETQGGDKVRAQAMEM